MREAINDNPMVQAAVIGVLLLAAAFFFLTTTGGEEEGEAGGTETTAPATTAPGAAPPPLSVTEAGAVPPASAEVPPIPPSAAAEAPPLPRAVRKAYESDQTLALVFVRNGGIDDRRVRAASAAVGSLQDVALFVVPARRISRYTSITGGVGVDRVPALVVVAPKRLDKSIPGASVSYGFQSPQSVVQAVVDAGYKGRTVDYHP